MFNRKTLISMTLVIIGSFIFSFGINAFVIPNHFGEGGVTGIGLILFYTLGWSPAITTFIFNSLLLIIGYRYLEKATIAYTIVSVFSMSIFLGLTKTWYEFVPSSPVVAAVAAGCVTGIALGIVMLGNGTTAGSDILAMLAKKYLGWNVSFSLLLIDVIIVTPLSFIIGLERAIITLIMLFIASQMINFILEGFNPKKSIMIISKQHIEIGTAIQKTVGRGITVLDGAGFYSKEDKKVLYLIVNRLQLMPIQRIIHEIDPTAFVIITDVKQVIGEGFTFYLEDKVG